MSSKTERLLRLFCLPRCVYCGELLGPEENALCADCRMTYDNSKLRNCSQCFSRVCRCTCVPPAMETHYVHRLIKVTRYLPQQKDLPTSALIFALKDDYRQDVFDFLTEEIEESVRAALPNCSDYVITAIPRRSEAVLEKGYDHAALLAKSLAKRLGCEYLPLLRSLAKRQQKGTHGIERLKNAKFALRFRYRKADLTKKKILLLDDIVTTGASMSSAAVLLRSLGAKEIVGVTFAIAYRDKTPFLEKT